MTSLATDIATRGQPASCHGGIFRPIQLPAIHSGEPVEENAVASYTADNLLYCKRPQTALQKHFKV